MKKWSKIVGFLSIVILTTLLLSSCGSNTSQDETQVNKTNEIQTETSTSGEKTSWNWDEATKVLTIDEDEGTILIQVGDAQIVDRSEYSEDKVIKVNVTITNNRERDLSLGLVANYDFSTATQSDGNTREELQSDMLFGSGELDLNGVTPSEDKQILPNGSVTGFIAFVLKNTTDPIEVGIFPGGDMSGWIFGNPEKGVVREHPVGKFEINIQDLAQ